MTSRGSPAKSQEPRGPRVKRTASGEPRAKKAAGQGGWQDVGFEECIDEEGGGCKEDCGRQINFEEVGDREEVTYRRKGACREGVCKQVFCFEMCVAEESGGGSSGQGLACRRITCREEAAYKEEVFK